MHDLRDYWERVRDKAAELGCDGRRWAIELDSENCGHDEDADYY